MGSSQFQVPKDVREQWVESSKNGQKVVQNLVTCEVFSFLVLSKLKEQQNISNLISRSIYSIPKTPKIIILNDQQGALFLLVQEFQTTLSGHLKRQRLLTDVLILLEKVVVVMKSLVKKYGAFHLRDELMGIDSNQEFMMWINESKYKNYPSSRIDPQEQGQALMLHQLLIMFNKYSKVSLFGEKHLKESRSFDEFQKELVKIIKRKKEEIMDCSKREKMNERMIVRALSPQTSFGSHRIGLFKNSNAKDTSSKAQKRTAVPKFIKNMNDKKNGFLDSLNHKRTMTIQESDTGQSIPESKPYQTSSKRLESHSQSLKRNRNQKICSMKNILNDQKYNSSSGDLINHNKEKERKINSFWKSPNQHSNYWQPNIESRLFQSFQESPTVPPVPFNASLKLYTGTVAESKHIDDRDHEAIVKEQSHDVSKTLQEQFNDFFSTGSRSPRFLLEATPESVQLEQQFCKVIDF